MSFAAEDDTALSPRSQWPADAERSSPAPWDGDKPDWPGHSAARGAEHVVRYDLDDESDVYPMVHHPRGIAYIINNKNFARKSGMPKRNGTDVDAKALDKVR